MANFGLLAPAGLQERSGRRIGHDMQVIALTSQKGGSGKSTLAGHLGVEAARAGNGPVAVIDTDPQGSIAAWGRARAAEEPAIFTASPAQLPAMLAHLHDKGYRLVFVDTPPAVTEAIADVVGLADLVLIPTRPSPHDLRAVGATVDIVEAHGRAMIFVVNSATRGARITAEAAVALSQHGTVAPVTVHHRVDFAVSMIDGRTVMELNATSPSAREITALWAYVADRLDRQRAEAVTLMAPEPPEDHAPVHDIAPVIAPVRPDQPGRGGFGRRHDGPRV